MKCLKLVILLFPFFLIGCGTVVVYPSKTSPELEQRHTAYNGESIYQYQSAHHSVPNVGKGQWLSSLLGKQELLYNGVADNRLVLTYREYTLTDLARPSFFQSNQYEYNDGAEINFRGARFKVYKADNESIEYEILNGFPNTTSDRVACAEVYKVQQLTANTISDPSGVCKGKNGLTD